MTIPQQNVPSSPLMSQPYFLVDSSGNPISSTNPQQLAIVTTTLYTVSLATQGSGNSGDLDLSKLKEVSIDITTTAQAGTNPTIQFFWERKGADNVYYKVWQTVSWSAASNTTSTSIGPGCAYNQSLGLTGRLEWVVGGSATPTWTFSVNVYGKSL